ncbi:uncharacterized protein LOC110892571 [Helianthus annuus]|uniref:uncharacterized protein LOC110892571 n=1 Tax=Helianthus annuus TaxID=4232 RepID=UPI000B8F085C|nr:uncharacterized protein LOC110892571 [Helianthus annuus]
MAGGEGSIPPPVAARDPASTSLQCPMLTSTNYNIWAIRIKAVFRVHGILQALEPGEQEVEAKKDDMAVALLLQAIPEELVFQVAQFQKAKEIWEALKTRYVGVERVREAKIEQLENEFESLTMKETETIDSFAGRISQWVTKAASLGTTYEDKKLTRKLLGSVPAKYVPIVASIEQFADLKAMTFQEAIGRLKTFEDRIKNIEFAGENQSKLMFAGGESSSSHKSYNNSGGRGRGGSNNRSRGRGRGLGQGRDTSQNRDNGQNRGAKGSGQKEY